MKTAPLLYFFLCLGYCLYGQNPGGVSGSHMWYKTQPTSVLTSVYEDFSVDNREILSQGVFEQDLFNYNSSLGFTGTQELSFSYTLENLSTATIFIVYKLEEEQKYALIHSDWDSEVSDHLDSGTENPRSFKYTTAVVKKRPFNNLSYPESNTTYSRTSPFINSLLWYDFNTENLYNSYGVTDESRIFVGSTYDSNNVLDLKGSMPEFIIYNKGLGLKERLRVESYLAVKYGITLQKDVNYYNSIGDILWHKENNVLFGNRVFGIGRDNNSGLHQKQSKSSHQEGESLVVSITDLALTNADNGNEFIEDNNFILIGDTNESQTELETLNSGLRKIKRTWLLEGFGNYLPLVSTEFHYNMEDLQLEPDDVLWLLVDPTATEDTVSDFQGTQVVYYPVSQSSSLLGSNYALFEELYWSESSNTYAQFTFALGPRMLINPVVREMECDATTGHLDLEIIGGIMDYSIEIESETTGYYAFLDQIDDSELTLYSLPEGTYTITVTDATGYIQTNTFEVSAFAGLAVDLGADIALVTGQTITLDASVNVTVNNVSYEWYVDNSLIPEATSGELTVEEPSVYTVRITNIDTGCKVKDEIIIIEERTRLGSINSNVRIYPNPIERQQQFVIEIQLQNIADVTVEIYDVNGKLISQKEYTDNSFYQLQEKLYVEGSLYLIKVITEEFTQVEKLIIK